MIYHALQRFGIGRFWYSMYIDAFENKKQGPHLKDRHFDTGRQPLFYPKEIQLVPPNLPSQQGPAQTMEKRLCWVIWAKNRQDHYRVGEVSLKTKMSYRILDCFEGMLDFFLKL